VDNQINLLVRLASLLVRDGFPIEKLTSIPALLDPVLVDRGLRQLLTSNGDSTPKADATIYALVSMARYLKLQNTQIETLSEMAKKIRGERRPTGMNARNRNRLTPLKNPHTQLKLQQLPHVIAAQLRNKPTLTYEDATRMRLAVAVEIALFAPMRVGNLANLDFFLHLNCVGEELLIFIPECEVKNEQALHFVLRRESLELINLYRTRFRPLLEKTPSSALFPCRNGGAMSGHALGRCITDGLRRELGLTMNPHLFRHYAAYRYLKEHPGEYEVVRRLLGHKSIQTTMAFYAEMEAEMVARRFQGVVTRSYKLTSTQQENPF
jgi:site-specific recombinase XerD